MEDSADEDGWCGGRPPLAVLAGKRRRRPRVSSESDKYSHSGASADSSSSSDRSHQDCSVSRRKQRRTGAERHLAAQQRAEERKLAREEQARLRAAAREEKAREKLEQQRRMRHMRVCAESSLGDCLERSATTENKKPAKIARESTTVGLAERTPAPDSWTCASCGCSSAEAGRKAAGGVLCLRCGTRAKQGKPALQKATGGGFLCGVCGKAFANYKQLLGHEKLPCSSEVTLIIRFLPSFDENETEGRGECIAVTLATRLDELRAAVASLPMLRAWRARTDRFLLFRSIDAQRRGAKPLLTDKHVEKLLTPSASTSSEPPLIYVQPCLVKWDRASLLNSLSELAITKQTPESCELLQAPPTAPHPQRPLVSPMALQLLAGWRLHLPGGKRVGAVFPTTWDADTSDEVGFDWGNFAQQGDTELTDTVAERLARGIAIDPAKKSFLLYSRGEPATDAAYFDDVVWLRGKLAPMLRHLVRASRNERTALTFHVIFPAALLRHFTGAPLASSLLEANSEGQELPDFVQAALFPSQSRVQWTALATAPLEAVMATLSGEPLDGTAPAPMQQDDNPVGGNAEEFVVLEVMVDEADSNVQLQAKQYLEKLASYLEQQGGENGVTLEELEQTFPPPRGCDLQALLTESPLFNLYEDDDKLYVTLADEDGSEPEAGLDWDVDGADRVLDEEEEMQLLARLAPSETAIFEFIGKYLSTHHHAPTHAEVEDHFSTFHNQSVATRAQHVQQMLADANTYAQWYTNVDTSHIQPGQKGFNERADQVMRAVNLNDESFTMHPPTANALTDDIRPQPYQRTVSFLVHPYSVASRLLMVHRTGAGKTYSMIRILDNFFFDPRPKVVIMPTLAVANNFYLELTKFPSRYRDFIHNEFPQFFKTQDASTSPQVSDRQKIQCVCDALMMRGAFVRGQLRPRYRLDRGDRCLPAGPLRVYTYMRAGGRTVTALDKNKKPLNALIKVMWDEECRNPYTNKIVLMDEVHNMTQEKVRVMNWLEKLEALRDMLGSAENAVVVGLTATPCCSSASEAYPLLRAIRGPHHRSPGDSIQNFEGLVSYFNSSPTSVFPRVLPHGTPALAMPHVVQVPLESTNRRVYLEKETELTARRITGVLSEDTLLSRLSNYCTMATYYTRAGLERTALIETPRTFASKAFRIAEDVVRHWQTSGGKAVVMLHRLHGWKALCMVVDATARQAGLTVGCYPPCLPHELDAAPASILQRFNHPDNDNASDLGVLVVDAREAGEGCSFFAVRRLYLADVPPSWLSL
eukprot:gnl/Spiro4/11692_TR6169_c0_g1_i1.p1 gnl/Spiro4/11692_TR6169_c0_g1~~gnl/Spiro4/11692_TR6169_c0_g1_i1.p1  ORF type:complete len:1269 (+),score=378.98 gnl/Spiro4/11692_TR6169_c0_g1_i1:59-3865(+)